MRKVRAFFVLSNLKYLIAFLLPFTVVLIVNTHVDNDSWYVLSEGREIVENGIYYEDALSMHEGLSVTVQNYGFAVVYWLIYSAFGVKGLYLGMILLLALICLLLYRIYLLISDNNTKLSLILMTLTSTILGLMFVVTRAQMVSYVIFLAAVYILELYVKNNDKKKLWIIPFLSLAQINLHSSLWLMLPLLMGVYILDLIIQGKQCRFLIVVLLLSVAVGFINPYGIDMIVFILRSYIDGGIQGLVKEMQPFAAFSHWKSVATYAGIVIVVLLGFLGNGKDVKLRYLLLLFVFLGLGLNTMKGMSNCILVMFLPIAAMYRKLEFPRFGNLKMRGIMSVCVFTVLVGVIGARMFIVLNGLIDYPDGIMRDAINVLDARVEEKAEDKKSVRLYSGYDDGGYLEFRGYKPYIDPRAEVFLKTNNGKEDILREYSDFRRGKTRREEFLEKYDFEYIVARGDSDPFYWDGLDGYKLIYDNDELETRVYEKE